LRNQTRRGAKGALTQSMHVEQFGGGAMKDSIRSIVEQFGPDGDPVLKWIGFAVVFLFVIVFGVAISATATAIANLLAAFLRYFGLIS
jgi:hypothetical protein